MLNNSWAIFLLESCPLTETSKFHHIPTSRSKEETKTLKFSKYLKITSIIMNKILLGDKQTKKNSQKQR